MAKTKHNTGLQNFDWTPTSDSEREQVRAELGRILSYSLFIRSSRYAALLQYVVEQSLNGNEDEIKERMIGVNVFNRPLGYDTNADPVVRFCAAEVRKRLAQYYQVEPGTHIVISLPTGTYVPQFGLRELPVEPNPEFSDTKLEDQNPLPALMSEPVPRSEFTRRWPLLMSAIAVLVALIAAPVCWLHLHDPLGDFWAAFLSRSTPVMICTGILPAGRRTEKDTSNLSIEEHFIQSGDRVSLATASAIAKVSGFLQVRKTPYTLLNANQANLDTLHDHPLVLINANNNYWTLFLDQSLRYQFGSHDNIGEIIDTQHPGQAKWQVDFNQPFLSQTQDYAIVAHFYSPTIQAPVMLLAGIGSNGTQAAANFAVSPKFVAELQRRVPKGSKNMNFEAVLRVEVLHGQLGATEIVSTYYW